MLGGSADLTGSNLTDFPGCGARHISYGVREFGMAAIMNGVAPVSYTHLDVYKRQAHRPGVRIPE